MKQAILSGTFFLLIIFLANAQSQPLPSNQFIQKDKGNGETETYQCIQIRRGDKITLTGTLSMYDNGEGLKYLILSSEGGRLFLLKGELLPDLKSFFLLDNKTEKIVITGTVLFEGLGRRPAELDVTKFRLSKKN